jgi:hypothetical protein
MEVQRNSIDDRPRTVDLTRKNREAIAASNPPLVPPAPMSDEALEAMARDRIDVSPAGREITDPAAERPDERRRTERLHELATLHERGELNSDERVERAAVRLLESL